MTLSRPGNLKVVYEDGFGFSSVESTVLANPGGIWRLSDNHWNPVQGGMEGAVASCVGDSADTIPALLTGTGWGNPFGSWQLAPGVHLDTVDGRKAYRIAEVGVAATETDVFSDPVVNSTVPASEFVRRRA